MNRSTRPRRAVYAGVEPAVSCVTGRRNNRYSNTPNKQTTFQTERPILDLNVRTYPRVSFRARNSQGLKSYRYIGLLRLSRQMRAHLTQVCTFYQLLPRMKLKVFILQNRSLANFYHNFLTVPLLKQEAYSKAAYLYEQFYDNLDKYKSNCSYHLFRLLL